MKAYSSVVHSWALSPLSVPLGSHRSSPHGPFVGREDKEEDKYLPQKSSLILALLILLLAGSRPRSSPKHASPPKTGLI